MIFRTILEAAVWFPYMRQRISKIRDTAKKRLRKEIVGGTYKNTNVWTKQ